jgi:hypothetical protein
LMADMPALACTAASLAGFIQVPALTSRAPRVPSQVK